MKATIFFRGREMAHPEIGRRILERLIEELADVAIAGVDAADGRQQDAHHPLASPGQAAGGAQAGDADDDGSERDLAGPGGALCRDGIVGRVFRPAPEAGNERLSCRNSRRTGARRSASRRPGTGKFLRSKAFKRHLLSSKTTKEKRHLSGTVVVSDQDAAKVKRMLPYK